jgi:redox-sensitive bicupin YhaK (pirin superfamily)
VRDGGAVVRVLAGEAFGARSPVATLSRLVYLDVKLDADASVELPETLGARGVYVIDGEVSCGAASYAPGRMLVLAPRGAVRVAASRAARFVVVGGDSFPEPRHLWWNFASSSEARIDRARGDWLERRGDPAGPFPLVPGDEQEFIPIPE